MISRIFAHFKKATHVVVLLSYLFHGVAPAFATRTSFVMEEEKQKKVTSIDDLHSIIRKRARNEALWNEKKHEAFSLTSQNTLAPVREEQRPYDGRHLGFRTQVKSFEEGYTLKVQSLPSQMNGSVWPGVQLTLTQKNGDEVRTLENRTFSSKTFNASTFDSMAFDEEEQQNVLPFKDRMNRSLGFSYDLKGVGRIYVCWEGSLLLHNLQFRDVALNIQTTGAILANNLDGSRLNLEGRAIAFGGENNKISTLSMSFGEGLESEGQGLEGQRTTDLGSRIAHVMPGTILVTHDLSVQGGILQNSGRLSALKSFEGIDTHVINDDHITAEGLTLKGGTLKNQGTLKAPVTAEGITLMDNSGVIEGSWSVSSNSFINTGSITGTGRLKADVLENYGLLGDANSVFNIQKTVRNDGYLTAKRVTGNGTFTNHNTFETEVLDVPVFLNQQRENVPFKPSVTGDSLTITKRVRQFTNEKDAKITVKRLVMEKREGVERQVKNDGVIEGDNNTKATQVTLQGDVENNGSIRTKNFEWSGGTFKTEDFKADHIQLEGERLQNLGSFEALSGSLFLHHLENQDDMNLTLSTRSKVVSLINKGCLTLNGTCGVRTLINEKKAKLFLRKGSLITRQLQNNGTVTMDGFVTVLRDGRLQFGEPSVLYGTWQAPERIQGDLGLGVHLSSLKFDRLKKMPETDLHLYGKSFSNTSDRVFLHPLHILVEDFKNTKTLRVPTLTVDAKTIENDGSITGSDLTLHATQKGQNAGQLEATERLDVDLPQIDSLGTLISKGDLFFKTRDRSITLGDNQSWLQVGRNLHLTLLNGALHVKDHHKFPGDVKVKAGSFTLEGDLETVGDLGVQTEGDINILVKTRTPKPKFTLADLPKPTPDYLDLSTEPDVYEYVLSRMKSGGTLRLQGQNVNNTGGEILGEHALTVEALGHLVNGTRVETKRTESRRGHTNGGRFYYRIPEFKGIGAYLRTMGPMSLIAGSNIHNNHADIRADGTLNMNALATMTNRAGNIRSGGTAHLEGGEFKNVIEPVVEVVTGRDNCGDNNHQWYVNDRYMYTGRYNHPLQEFAGSKPATLQTVGDLTLDFRRHILNQASNILAGGAIQIAYAKVEFLSTTLSASIRRQGDDWPKKETAGILQAVVSSDKGISMRNIQGLVDAGMMSAPHINVNGSPFVTFEDLETARARALVPHKQIQTNFSLKSILQDLQSLPFSSESEQPFNPQGHVIIGSVGRIIPPIFGNTAQILFALQQAFAEHYHKGYILPHLKPLEQLIQLHNNARQFVLKQRGRGALPWETLGVSEIEASKTGWPMILYRPTLVEDKEYLVPEYWGPKDLIHRFLMEPCGAGVADNHIKAQTVDYLNLNGNLYAGQTIQTESEECFLGPQVVRKNTLHGHMDITIGGNQETGKGGKISHHASKRLRARGFTATAPDGTIKLTSDGTMDLGTAMTHRLHDDEETRIEETISHPTHLESGDISIKALKQLILEATQAKATRTIWAEGSNILMPSVVDTYHQEQNTTQKDLFGSSTTKETTHRETHQVLNFAAGTSITTRATSGGLDLTAPIMTAPQINFDFSDSGMLLRSFEDWSSYNREELDKNAFLITSSVSGSSSKKVGEAQMNGHVTVPKGKPIHIESREDTYQNNGPLTQAFPGATFDSKSDEFQSWEETKTSVGPGLSTLIAIGVSMIMPGIGTGVSGAMFTKGAETLSTQALVGMINNGGNVFKTLEDMTSSSALRNTITTVATAGLTHKLSEITKIPLDPKGSEFVDHLESRMIHMAAQIPVETALSRKGFGEVFQDSLTCAASKLVGSYGAANIGSFCDSYEVAEFGQYLAHAAVGAAAAKVRDGDVAASAIGAVVGRAVGNHLLEEMDQYGIDEDHLDYERALDRAVNIARFTAASFACVLGQDAEDAACAAGNAARYGTVPSSPFTQKTPAQEAYAAMRREGVSEEMAKAALNSPQFQSLLQEGLSFEMEVQQSEAYHAQILREAEEATKSSGILHLEVYPYKTPTDRALEYFQKAAVFTNEHPHLTAATFYGLQIAIGGPLNVLRGMVQDVLIGDQRDAIRQVLKTSIANHLNITEQSDAADKLKFDIAFTSGEFGAGFLLGAGIKVVKDSAQNVAKAIRREERALQPSVTSSRKRQLEHKEPPNPKEPRTQNKTSPSEGSNSASIQTKPNRAGKQKKLRSFMQDPKISSVDRGWLRQEANLVSNKKRETLRVPPGKELAHKRGFEASKGFDYDHTVLQDQSLHKLQHKFDDRGRKNKTPSITNKDK